MKRMLIFSVLALLAAVQVGCGPCRGLFGWRGASCCSPCSTSCCDPCSSCSSCSPCSSSCGSCDSCASGIAAPMVAQPYYDGSMIQGGGMIPGGAIIGQPITPAPTLEPSVN